MKDLFGNEVVLPPLGNKHNEERIAIQQYRQLISTYGKKEGRNCKDCRFCITVKAGSKNVKKCKNAKISHSQATDWNGRWTACGRFEL